MYLIIYLYHKTTTNNIMTTQEFKNIATKKINSLSTEDLITEAKKLVNDFSDSASLVFEIVLDVLCNRLPENEFIEFDPYIDTL